jgi:hypothetical protein
MRHLLILLVHPVYAIRSREAVPVPALVLFITGYLFVCGISFSYLFPRLLNRVPWLGFFRKLHPGTWNPRMDEELFIRGAAMGLVVIASFSLVYTSLLLARRVRCFPDGILQAFATCIPILMTCAVGYLFHYVHPSLGLAPVFGLFASTCLQAFFLRDLHGLHRTIVVYLAPAIAVGQVYGCFLLLP